MRRHRYELGFLRIHVGGKARERLAQILDRSLVFGPCRMDQNEENDNPKNAAYHSQDFHRWSGFSHFSSAIATITACLGSAETDSFSVHATNADEKTGEDCLSQGLRALRRVRPIASCEPNPDGQSQGATIARLLQATSSPQRKSPCRTF